MINWRRFTTCQNATRRIWPSQWSKNLPEHRKSTARSISLTSCILSRLPLLFGEFKASSVWKDSQQRLLRWFIVHFLPKNILPNILLAPRHQNTQLQDDQGTKKVEDRRVFNLNFALGAAAKIVSIPTKRSSLSIKSGREWKVKDTSVHKRWKCRRSKND